MSWVVSAYFQDLKLNIKKVISLWIFIYIFLSQFKGTSIHENFILVFLIWQFVPNIIEGCWSFCAHFQVMKLNIYKVIKLFIIIYIYYTHTLTLHSTKTKMIYDMFNTSKLIYLTVWTIINNNIIPYSWYNIIFLDFKNTILSTWP